MTFNFQKKEKSKWIGGHVTKEGNQGKGKIKSNTVKGKYKDRKQISFQANQRCPIPSIR